jgi:hypothetical protein
MDDRISYLNRMSRFDWDLSRHGSGRLSTASRVHVLQERVFVLTALLAAVVPYLVGVSLALNAEGVPETHLFRQPAEGALLGPLVVGGLLFWCGLGLLVGRLWWPAYFCGLLGLTLSALYSLPFLDGVHGGTLLRLAAMAVLVVASGAGGYRFRHS